MESKLQLNQETLEALQDLIRVNLESAKTLREAAEQVDHALLTSYFEDIAAKRTGHAKVLETYVLANDQEVESDSETLAHLHRLWIKLRGAVSHGDPKAILAEAERAEDRIKKCYEDLLVQTAGSAMNDILMSQMREVKLHHDQIRDLRDAQ